MLAKIKSLPWELITTLGLVGLIRPIVKIIGDVAGIPIPPLVTYILTFAIAATWIAVVIMYNVKKPMYVLAGAGAVYAIASIALAVVIQLGIPSMADPEAKLHLLLTVGFVGSLVFNVVYGAFLGVLAEVISVVGKNKRKK